MDRSRHRRHHLAARNTPIHFPLTLDLLSVLHDIEMYTATALTSPTESVQPTSSAPSKHQPVSTAQAEVITSANPTASHSTATTVAASRTSDGFHSAAASQPSPTTTVDPSLAHKGSTKDAQHVEGQEHPPELIIPSVIPSILTLTATPTSDATATQSSVEDMPLGPTYGHSTEEDRSERLSIVTTIVGVLLALAIVVTIVKLVSNAVRRRKQDAARNNTTNRRGGGSSHGSLAETASRGEKHSEIWDDGRSSMVHGSITMPNVSRSVSAREEHFYNQPTIHPSGFVGRMMLSNSFDSRLGSTPTLPDMPHPPSPPGDLPPFPPPKTPVPPVPAEYSAILLTPVNRQEVADKRLSSASADDSFISTGMKRMTGGSDFLSRPHSTGSVSFAGFQMNWSETSGDRSSCDFASPTPTPGQNEFKSGHRRMRSLPNTASFISSSGCSMNDISSLRDSTQARRSEMRTLSGLPTIEEGYWESFGSLEAYASARGSTVSQRSEKSEEGEQEGVLVESNGLKRVKSLDLYALRDRPTLYA